MAIYHIAYSNSDTRERYICPIKLLFHNINKPIGCTCLVQEIILTNGMIEIARHYMD